MAAVRSSLLQRQRGPLCRRRAGDTAAISISHTTCKVQQNGPSSSGVTAVSRLPHGASISLPDRGLSLELSPPLCTSPPPLLPPPSDPVLQLHSVSLSCLSPVPTYLLGTTASWGANGEAGKPDVFWVRAKGKLSREGVEREGSNSAT